jgi:hypothetical protein
MADRRHPFKRPPPLTWRDWAPFVALLFGVIGTIAILAYDDTQAPKPDAYPASPWPAPMKDV